VTTETTAQSGAPISVQQPAVEALAILLTQYPALPAAYITIHAPYELRPGRLDLQMENAWEFELWRDALEIPPADVHLYVTSNSVWLAAVTRVLDAKVEISGFGIQLTPEQATAHRVLTTGEVTA
jgi:hypothetical protein